MERRATDRVRAQRKGLRENKVMFLALRHRAAEASGERCGGNVPS